MKQENNYKKGIVALFGILILSFLIEIFANNFNAITFDEDNLIRKEISLPFQKDLGRYGIVLTPENNTFTVRDVFMDVKNVYIEGWSPRKRYVEGNLGYSEDSYKYITIPSRDFSFVPGGENNSAYINVAPNSKLRSFSISFNQADLAGGVLITKLVVNQKPTLSLSLSLS